MIPKLILSDIDGTLLPYGQSAISPELFPLIRRLRRAGIRFCPASGRQYHSLRTLFAPVADELVYLCENGCAVYGQGTEKDAKLLSCTELPLSLVQEMAEDVWRIPGCELTIAGIQNCYLYRCSEGFRASLTPYAGYYWRAIDQLSEIHETTIKAAVYCPHGPEEPARILAAKWAGRCQVTVSGQVWLDLALGDKGTGLRSLCGALGIAPEETMAFGDNWNDVTMLETAGEPWLMASAAPALRSRFPRQCTSVPEVLRALLEGIGA